MKRIAVVVVLLAAVLFLTSSMTQKPAAAGYREVLTGLIGKKCSLYTGDGPARLILGNKNDDYEIVRIGDDFVEIGNKNESRYLPLSRVETVIWK
jgi:hypothetical protein